MTIYVVIMVSNGINENAEIMNNVCAYDDITEAKKAVDKLVEFDRNVGATTIKRYEIDEIQLY